MLRFYEEQHKQNNGEMNCTKKCFRSCDQFRYRVEHITKGKSVEPGFIKTVRYFTWLDFRPHYSDSEMGFVRVSGSGTAIVIYTYKFYRSDWGSYWFEDIFGIGLKYFYCQAFGWDFLFFL